MSQNTAHRIGFKFWLNLDKPDEETIADTIEHLKSNRSFTETIRDGIRLIVDLRAGNTTVLCELFPFVKTKLQSSSADGNDNSDIKREIARLETLILQQGRQPETPVMKPISGGLPSLGGLKPLAPPPATDDDDMILSVTKAKGDGNASQNFLASMQALQQ